MAALTEAAALAVDDTGGTCWLAMTWPVRLLQRLPASRRRTCCPWAANAVAAASAMVARAQKRGVTRCMNFFLLLLFNGAAPRRKNSMPGGRPAGPFRRDRARRNACMQTIF